MRFAEYGFSRQFSAKLALLWLGVLLSGCGPSFDPEDQLRTLRVLGVQKDQPYVKPGDSVNLTMLWEDASPSAGRPIQIAWSGLCVDPPGDLYYGCFAQPAVFQGLSFNPSTMPGADKTSVMMPTTYTDSKGNSAPVIRPTAAENNTPYGIGYVFFAVCAGTISIDPSLVQTSAANGSASASPALPIVCKDDAGKLLDSDSFVAGYTTIYAYDMFANNNPAISGFEFNGQALPKGSFCVGPATDATMPDDCASLAESPIGDSLPPDTTAIDCTTTPPDPRCIPTCADDGKSSCHGYAIRPTVDKTDFRNQDQDGVSVMQLGHAVGEQMWIDFYSDGGGFKSPTRLLNDATNGWNDDYGTDFYAAKDAKISRVWALVHDNRGGVSWAGIELKTQ
ncbi:MAG TPA: hypothetical protein VGM44_21245 [Polyangiaceae bacterium]|jgi:hypothetical protein